MFDIRRYQTDLHKFAADANARGGAIILFTDQWLSPIAPIAKQLFCLRTDTGAAWDSTASIIALLDLIIAKMGRPDGPGSRAAFATWRLCATVIDLVFLLPAQAGMTTTQNSLVIQRARMNVTNFTI